jgi:hypothetical protein
MIEKYLDFSNIIINDYIDKYLIEKDILSKEDLKYYPFILFTNHYKFTEELKSKFIKSISYDYTENEIKFLIIDIICNSNPICLCPIIYKYKFKINNQNNMIKKIIVAGKSQEELNKSFELRLNSRISKKYLIFFCFSFASLIIYLKIIDIYLVKDANIR